MREPADQLLPAPGVGRRVRAGRRHAVHRRHLLHARDAHLPARLQHLDRGMGEKKSCNSMLESQYELNTID